MSPDSVHTLKDYVDGELRELGLPEKPVLNFLWNSLLQ